MIHVCEMKIIVIVNITRIILYRDSHLYNKEFYFYKHEILRFTNINCRIILFNKKNNIIRQFIFVKRRISCL